MPRPFWERKTLQDMTPAEWESLCDGCALCCQQKLEDEDSGKVYYTDIACRLLDLESCRCSNYPRRVELVPECMVLGPDSQQAFAWLPSSCAYRRLAEGKTLPRWHPLLTGNPDSVHEAGISMRGEVVSETETSEWTVLRVLG